MKKNTSPRQTKQVIIWRHDLKCRKGKMMAQAAHASLKVILDQCSVHNASMRTSLSPAFINWMETGYAKIVVRVENEEELLAIYQQARDNNIITTLITDAGLTEFKGIPTITCCAIGPDYVENIDPITGHLPLL